MYIKITNTETQMKKTHASVLQFIDKLQALFLKIMFINLKTNFCMVKITKQMVSETTALASTNYSCCEENP